MNATPPEYSTSPVSLADSSSSKINPMLKRFFNPSQDDIFMHYMPGSNIVVCGCGKCGTSSMYEFIYEKTFGHPWTYEWEPYIQEVMSDRWEGRWRHITDESKQAEIMHSANSFALIRDPKERLISAWKSKLSCGDTFGVDYNSKAYVCKMRFLQGLPCDGSTCMSLDDFAEALLDIYERGLSRRLDRHFLPQNHGCFDKFPPSRWTKLATIEEPHSFALLAQQIGAESDAAPHEHGSTARVYVSERTSHILDVVTKEEYKLLGDYLPRKSKVREGAFFGMRPNVSIA